ncbi:MAG TPA: hypothetical protein VFB34_09495 [Chloroflexota bacterium]|nr:hypothetical protein [Chloroflexota bacterium]
MDDRTRNEDPSEIRRLVEKQAAELDLLRREVRDLAADREPHPGLVTLPAKSGAAMSRTTMLRTVGAAAVGAVAAAALIPQSVHAANGQPLILGHSTTNRKPNTATQTTELKYEGKKPAKGVGKGVAFLVNDTTFTPAGAAWPAAVGAWAGKNFPHGLFAYTESKKPATGIAPSAVAAFSLNGYGGYFSGKLAQISLEPQKGQHPGSGQAGDLFVDANNDLWFCKGGTDWYHVV